MKQTKQEMTMVEKQVLKFCYSNLGIRFVLLSNNGTVHFYDEASREIFKASKNIVKQVKKILENSIIERDTEFYIPNLMHS